MYSPASRVGPRHSGRGLVYELFQLLLWAVMVLPARGGLRSALGRGAAPGGGGPPPPAVRPRRRKSAPRGRFPQPALP